MRGIFQRPAHPPAGAPHIIPEAGLPSSDKIQLNVLHLSSNKTHSAAKLGDYSASILADMAGFEPAVPKRYGSLAGSWNKPLSHTSVYNVGFSRFCGFPRLVLTLGPNAIWADDLLTLPLYAGYILNTGKHPGDFVLPRCTSPRGYLGI